MTETATLLTWNLWFGEFEQLPRLTAALDVVRAEAPDVIAFQEVVHDTLVEIRNTPWVRNEYHLSDPSGEYLDRYGTVVLTRRPPVAVHHIELSSYMGRMLVAVDLAFSGATLRVGAVHLESLDETLTRIKQLQRIFDFLAGADSWVLMGDMNFDVGEPEEDALPAEVVDAWPYLRPGERGATRDTEQNPMAALFTREPKVKRIDRVFLHSGTNRWRPAAVRLVGTEPLPDSGGPVFPSDHFGLICRLECTTSPSHPRRHSARARD